MKTHPLTQPRKRLVPRGILPSLVFLCHLATVSQAQSGEGYTLKNSSFTAGTGTSTSGLYRLSGTFRPTHPTNLHNDKFTYNLFGDWVSVTHGMVECGGNCVTCEPNAVLTYAPSGGSLVLAWTVPGYRLESTPLLQGPASVWTPVPGSSPLTVPTSLGPKFYRLVCTH